jgi:tetratricopeptide (TPR) repeat protein
MKWILSILNWAVCTSLTFAQSAYQEAFHEYKYGDIVKSIYLLNISLAKHESVANSYLYRSAAQTYLGDFVSAKAGLDTVMAIDSATDKLHYYYGRLYLFSGNYIMALSQFDIEISKNTTYSDAYDCRSIAKYLNGDIWGALLDSKKAISIDSNNSSYYINRGYINIKLKMHIDAISDFTKSLRIEQSQKAYTNRGLAYALVDSDTLAIRDYTCALDINPKDAETLYLRGVSLRKIGKIFDACNDFKNSDRLGYHESKAIIKELKCD